MSDERPAGRFLEARWVHLAMLNYEIDPGVLTRHVPSGTELDLWQGRAFVSMVGFHFLDTRVLGVPIPFHRNFDEVNLRFYVRRESADGMRRGVVFVKELVPKWAIAWVARNVYGERYVSLPMRHVDRIGESEGRVEYGWRFGGAWSHLSVDVEGEPAVVAETSEEAFITEHYWGYAAQRDGGTVEYRVEHPRWRVWRATDSSFECDVASLYGAEFVSALRGSPSTAFLAEGSEVVVRRGRRLDATD